MTKRDAIITAIKNCERWMNGAVIVEDEEHGFDAIPGAYLTDISYGGSTNVVFRIDNLGDFGNVDIDDIENPETLDFIVDMVMETMSS